jgi:hypothetical protein
MRRGWGNVLVANVLVNSINALEYTSTVGSHCEILRCSICSRVSMHSFTSTILTNKEIMSEKSNIKKYINQQKQTLMSTFF